MCFAVEPSIKHISVGQHAAWAIDTSGAIFMSMGVNAKRENQMMNPAWIPMDNISKVREYYI